jgi:MFS family permease
MVSPFTAAETTSSEKPTMLHEEHPSPSHTEADSLHSVHDLEKRRTQENTNDIARAEAGDDVVTLKTWIVVWTMSIAYGASFWPVPFFSTIQSQVALSLGSEASQGTWMTSTYITCVTIAFMVCGANSDLFGRRWFIIMGCVLITIGSIIGGTSHHMGQTIVAHVIIGLGGGNCQLAAFAIAELLPNKWRHIGVVIADGVAFFCVIAGPVTARVAIDHGESWRWGYWSVVICGVICTGTLIALYYPPKHPRGIAWSVALKHLDWVGIFTFTAAAALILVGIVYVQLIPPSSPRVIGLLVSGFACLVFFGAWETLAPLKEPLTPTHLFTANRGRTLSFPFVVGFVVTM